MAVTFVDQVMANLATSANRAAFINTIALTTFAATSFTRRYGANGFTVDNVVLGPVADFQLQQLVRDDFRITGYSEQRSDRPERKQIDYRFHKQEILGWVDAAFTTDANFSLHVTPGSVPLGPTGDMVPAGWQLAPAPMTSQSKFLLALATDQVTLTYTLQVHAFISAGLSPTDDLRRILTVRRFLEADPAFLVSLDGTPDQRPFLFVQIYPTGAADGGPLGPAAITQLFDAADVLAAFVAPPA
jgi:hypothetical protein